MTDATTSGRTAFVCAMPMELKPLVRKLSMAKASIGPVRAYTGRCGNQPVAAIVTGMGTALASAGVKRLLDACEAEGAPVTRVMVVGITGAVDNVTPIGTLILPEVVVNASTGASFHPSALGDGTPGGTMWTTDTLITDLDAIAALRARGVVSLDMETAAVAEVCEQRGLPWTVFRVISDRATDGSIDDEIFRLSHQDGTPNWGAVVRFVLRHPGEMPRMARLAKQANLATNAAADAAIKACSATA
jgi:adenosylhomocysteine nucleosidase